MVGEAGISCRALLVLVHAAHRWVSAGQLCSVLLPLVCPQCTNLIVQGWAHCWERSAGAAPGVQECRSTTGALRGCGTCHGLLRSLHLWPPPMGINANCCGLGGHGAGLGCCCLGCVLSLLTAVRLRMQGCLEWCRKVMGTQGAAAQCSLVLRIAEKMLL